MANLTQTAAEVQTLLNMAGGVRESRTLTDSGTLVLADQYKTVYMNSGSANNLTVPPYISVAFPVGTTIEIVSIGAGQTTIVAGDGVTINSADAALKLRTQYSGGSLKKTATNTWLLVGDLA